MLEGDDAYFADLQQFIGPDEGQAAQAFARLTPRVIEVIQASLRRQVPSRDDLDDIAQEACLRLWRNRQTFQLRGKAAWWVFVKKAASSCAIDHFRKRQIAVSLDGPDFGEIPDRDLRTLEVLVEVLDRYHQVLAAADEIWLGKLGADAERSILAAKLFFVDKKSWADISRLLGAQQPGRPKLTRQQVDAWLSDPVILRHVAFDELYFSNAELAANLLGYSKLEVSEVDRLMDLVVSPEGRQELESRGETFRDWQWAEVYAILWRYKRSLLLSQLERLKAIDLKKDELTDLFDRCVQKFPFVTIMSTLQSQAGSLPALSSSLNRPGFWQRLVFQYFTKDEIAHRDILDRTEGAAARANYRLTPAMLNVWLSNGRLFTQLAEHFETSKGEKADV